MATEIHSVKKRVGKPSNPLLLAERRTQILEAATTALIESGYHRMTLSALALDCGLSKAALYRYFDGKEALFKAVLKHHQTGVLADFERIAAGGGNFESRVRGCLWQLYDRLSTQPIGRLTPVIAEASSQFPDIARFHMIEVVRPMLEHIKGLLDGGVASGEFATLDTEVFLQVMVGPPLAYSLKRAIIDRAQLPPEPHEALFEEHWLTLRARLRMKKDTP